MSQEIFSNIDPAMSGTDLADVLNDFKDAMVSGLSGTSRPTELLPGGYWVDTTNSPTTWSFRLWTGSDDVEVFKIDLASGGAAVNLAVDSFSIRKVSSDSVGALLELVKRRADVTGQVKSGDVVGEIRAVGRTNSATNPVVAKIIFTAGEDQTSTASGGTLSFYSTPEGSAALEEHMRFVGGIVESVKAHKLNAQILTAQAVATTASITQLSATKTVVEMTGSTATVIHGINSAQDTKVLTIHNRSTAVVTLRNQSATATAADRMKLPGDSDVTISTESSATLIYSVADSRWKVQNSGARATESTKTVINAYGEWTAPVGAKTARVVGFVSRKKFSPGGTSVYQAGTIDRYGDLYEWGYGDVGQLGNGSLTSRSGPIAVVGGLKAKRAWGTTNAGHLLTNDGQVYSWGNNAGYTLGTGVGPTVKTSSPVAVVGGLRFTEIWAAPEDVVALAQNGQVYTWGTNGTYTGGAAGVISSPVLIRGSIRFTQLYPQIASAGILSILGIATDGALYAWGYNAEGRLGIGNTTIVSSPVLVLGSLKAKKVVSAIGPLGVTTLCLTTGGDVYSWGLGRAGELANGSSGTNNRTSSPALILGGLKFNDIFTATQLNVINGASVFALTSDGTPYAWGDNSAGILGTGDTLAKSSPVAVVGGLKFKSISVGGECAIGLTEDGTAYAWGNNTYGQLGDNTVVSKSSPVAVLGGVKFASIDIQYSNDTGDTIFGTSRDGSLYAWGGGDGQGKTGTGIAGNRSTPTLVFVALNLEPKQQQIQVDIPVVAGQTYVVKGGPNMGFFGNTQLGFSLERIEIETMS